MAAPAGGDGSLRPLQNAMKLANRAIQLDTGNDHKEAYIEYLKSVNYISQILLEEAEQKADHEIFASDSQKLLKLAEQCLERARSTAGKLGTTDPDSVSLAPQISTSLDPPPYELCVAPLVSSELPCPLGHRRAHSDEARTLSPFPPPEVFKMLLASEAGKSKKELTPLEEASIQNQKLRVSYKARLSRLNPNQASQKTSLTLSLQRQMMENLVIAKAREETLKRKAQERRLRLQEKSDRLFCEVKNLSKEQKEQKALYTAVLEYDQDHAWSKKCKRALRSNPRDTALLTTFLCQVLSCPDHPITRLVERLQCQVYDQLYPFIILDYQPAESFSESCDESLPDEKSALLDPGPSTIKTSTSLQCLPSTEPAPLKHSFSVDEGLQCRDFAADVCGDTEEEDGELETSFEDLESLLPPKDIQKLTPVERIHYIVKEIHYVRDELLTSVMLSLDLPNYCSVQDACLECLDENFFSKLWAPLLTLYRQEYGAREESILQNMNFYANCHPSVVGVPSEVLPQDVKEPYKAAADELEGLVRHHTPLKKLKCLVKTLRIICACAEEYSGEPGKSTPIGADCLLPIMTYIVLRYRMSYLLSECAALQEFMYDGYMSGEWGYSVISLDGALGYLENLPKPPPPVDLE